MLKLTYKLIFLLIFPVSFVACQNKSEAENTKKGAFEDVKIENGQSLLWKIEGNGIKEPSYLFGTMHLIDEEYFVFPDVLKERIKSCDKIVMEVAGFPDASKLKDLMMAKEGETLKEMYSQEKYDSLINMASESLGLSKGAIEMMFGKMKPFAIISTASQMSFKGNVKSYEMTLMALSKEFDIPLGGVETIEQQLGFFDEIPVEKMKEIIWQTMVMAGEDSDEMEEMMKIYKAQDLEKLAKFMIESSPELMENEEILLTGRNEAWIPKIKKFIKKEKVFIAVGAAHLVGDKGVINLLKEEGYTLTPISTEK
jgi:uncharacterized protein YbaP (TraB family)